MIDGSGSEASGIGAKGEGCDPVAVVAEGPGRCGGEERVVDGDGDVEGGGGDEMAGLLVPQDRAEGRAAALVGVGLPQLHRPDLHRGFPKTGSGFLVRMVRNDRDRSLKVGFGRKWWGRG